MSDPVDDRAGGPGALTEGDLARALPDPPPPRPARRQAAIETAMALFDGAEAPALPPRPAPAPQRPGWWRTGRVQLGVLASAVLVAVIAVPIALEHPGVPVDPPRPAAPSDKADLALDTSDGAAAKPDAPAKRDAIAEPAERAPQPISQRADPSSRPPPAPAAAVPPAAVPPSSGAMPVLSAPPPPPPPPPPPAPVVAEQEAANEARLTAPVANRAADLMVTGTRVSRRAVAPTRRGDWTACTVDAPEDGLRGCGKHVRPGAKGGPGAAAGQLAEALALARSQDWAGAAAALDRAIALQPKLGIAYLNRGLVHERLGDLEAAAADLDRAVRFDPSARSYHARAQLRRARGDLRAAEADEQRAIDSDSK